MLKQALTVSAFVIGNLSTPAVAQDVPQARIDRILAMSPTDMARYGAWTSAAYHRLIGYMNSIEDPELRDFVLDMYDNPASIVFNATAAPDALRANPATGGPGHHHYPGGLAVYLVEVIEIAMG
jgi:hypothetical protein